MDVLDWLFIGALFFFNLLPVCFWAWWYLGVQKDREPFWLVVRCGIFGMISTIPFLLMKWFMPEVYTHTFHVDMMFAMLVFAGMGEELSKHTAVMVVMNEDRRACNELSDGIAYGVSAALGFAFVENMVFLLVAYFSDQSFPVLLQTYLLRGVITMFAHTIFSGYFGYFFARAYFLPRTDIITQSSFHITWKTILRRIHWKHFLFTVTRMHKNESPSTRSVDSIELVIEGLWCAVILHVVFNILLMWQWGGIEGWMLTIPFLLLFGGGLVVLYGKTISMTKG